MRGERPSVVVLAGPNGAGKSTVAGRLLVDVLGVSELVDADVLARALPRSEASAVTAGRAMWRRLDGNAPREPIVRSKNSQADQSRIRLSPGIPLVAGRRTCRGEGGLSRASGRSRRTRQDCSSPLSFGSAQLLRALSAFDDDLADVRQFDTGAAVDRLGCWSRDPDNQRRESVAAHPGRGRP